jgi:prepilin-type N-terminal cleavage/methylation domain-containing protein
MSAARAVRSDERGYTLTELLVGVTIALLVTAGAATVVMMAVRTQPHTTERAGQIQQGRFMLETLTRELRQGESIQGATTSQVSFLTYVPTAVCGGSGQGPSRLCLVTYSCGSATCSRTEAPPGGGAASTREVVSGITGPNVFEVDPLEPTYVAVRLVFPQESGEEAITLEDGAALRNYFDDTENPEA